MKISHIGLFINERAKVKTLAERVSQLLLEKGAFVYLLEEQASEDTKNATILDKATFLDTIDFLLVIGGDGTFLRGANLVALKNIPILGINKGRLGFLSELEDCDVKKAIDKVLLGEFDLEPRMMIHVSHFRNGECIGESSGLNDITINRNPMETTLYCEAYLLHEKIDEYLGDGLIVATPTGSTGYSMSVGGPLIYPGTDCFIITPIAPHNLGTRPVIVPADSRVHIYLTDDTKEAYLFCDGRLVGNMTSGDKIIVKQAREVIHLVHLRPHRFFETVRSKLF